MRASSLRALWRAAWPQLQLLLPDQRRQEISAAEGRIGCRPGVVACSQLRGQHHACRLEARTTIRYKRGIWGCAHPPVTLLKLLADAKTVI